MVQPEQVTDLTDEQIDRILEGITSYTWWVPLAMEVQRRRAADDTAPRAPGGAFVPQTADQLLELINRRIRCESLHRDEAAWADAFYDIALLLYNTKVVSA